MPPRNRNRNRSNTMENEQTQTTEEQVQDMETPEVQDITEDNAEAQAPDVTEEQVQDETPEGPPIPENMVPETPEDPTPENETPENPAIMDDGPPETPENTAEDQVLDTENTVGTTEDHGHEHEDHEHTSFRDLLDAELEEREPTPEMQNAILAILRGDIAPPKAKAGKKPGVCLCGCGGVTSPGRNYLPGHDARVKGYISRANKWFMASEEDRKKIKGDMGIPQVLLDHLDENPEFKVAEYDAETIRFLAEVVGVR